MTKQIRTILTCWISWLRVTKWLKNNIGKQTMQLFHYIFHDVVYSVFQLLQKLLID